MKKKDEESLSLTNPVVKSNKMIESMYHLSTVEQKLILSLCSKISSTDNSFNNIELSVKEFANFLGIDNKDYELNRTLKKKCEELASRTITINTGTVKKPVWLIFNWFHHIRYEVGKGVISMQFHETLEPYLLNMQKEYTKYMLGYVMKFSFEHSFRIYELMKEYEKIGERTLLLDDLKRMLFTEKEKDNKYQKYSHFKAKVLNKAITEINKQSDLNIELIKEEKQGKKVVGLVFQIRPHNYKYPMDVMLEREELRKKTKAEMQKLLNDIILRNYKMELKSYKTDLFDKEAITQLYLEIKEGEYEDRTIKYPIPYFTEILVKKHAMMTGEEITKSQITKYELEKIKENMEDTPLIEASSEVE